MPEPRVRGLAQEAYLLRLEPCRDPVAAVNTARGTERRGRNFRASLSSCLLLGQPNWKPLSLQGPTLLQYRAGMIRKQLEGHTLWELVPGLYLFLQTELDCPL